MRCVFTMFAEDVTLLPKQTFADALQRWADDPRLFVAELGALWKTMNEGGALPFVGKIWQFNGGLFADPAVLALTQQQILLLGLAAQSNWAEVEPAIFGTLLERALEPKERHRLGAHYTPRAYVERLVKPTIEEPLRTEWELVQAEVRQIIAGAKDDRKAMVEARKPVYAFYDRLCDLRVLDPACGSGNFLFVALDVFKRLENEILDLLQALGDNAIFNQHGRPVTPEQFLGIEIKRWAKEITELVLWIGYLQWQIRTRGWTTNVPEPVLRDYHNIEHRDAVLAYDRVEPLLGDDGEPVTRWDGETMKVHPVTGKEVPDDTTRVPVMRYVNPRKAEWPKADFVVGNPPYIGTRRMRLTLGDGYVEALTTAYPEVPENADYVMYWWYRAAELARHSNIRRFDFITTNSIAQIMNRPVVEQALNADPPISIRLAIPDHPWVDSADGAAVRVAMTVAERGPAQGARQTVLKEVEVPNGEVDARLTPSVFGRIGPDLRVGRSPSEAAVLRSNEAIAYWGVKFYGDGFILTPEEARLLLGEGERVLYRPFISGRDLTTSTRDLLAIDCDKLSEEQVADGWPITYQWLLTRVKPVRQHNPRAFKRERWWIFGENQPGMRAAVAGLTRYIATTETAKHRVFHLLSTKVLAEGTVAVIALDDAFFLGVLSSRVHVAWALAAGGTLEDRPRYNKTVCFDPFPFPAATNEQKQLIRELGEQLDAHRKRQQALHPDLTITGMYNVVEKLRSGEPLTEKEKAIHEKGLVSILKQMHDKLDDAVFEAYRWPRSLSDDAILERLVALNDERAEEEKRGIVRWLRPDFQNPQESVEPAQIAMAGVDAVIRPARVPAAPPEKIEWPVRLAERIAAVRNEFMISSDSFDTSAVMKRFKRARRRDIEEVLESLEALGLLVSYGEGDARQWKPVRVSATQARTTPIPVP